MKDIIQKTNFLMLSLSPLLFKIGETDDDTLTAIYPPIRGTITKFAI
jgi:hypothetical protein